MWFWGRRSKVTELDREVAAAARAVGKISADLSVERPGVAKDMIAALARDYAASLAKTKHLPESHIWRQFARRLGGDTIDNDFNEMPFDMQIRLAERVLTEGDFEQARLMYETLAEKHADDRGVATGLSALYNHSGDHRRAQAHLKSFFSDHPCREEERPGADKTLLIVSGFDGSEFRIGGSAQDGYYPYRRGGHFMLTHLLELEQYTEKNFTVTGDNTGRLSGAGHFDALINTIADADREEASLRSLDAYLAKNNIQRPVINHPGKVLATTRDGNYQRLNGLEGFLFPKTERVQLSERAPRDIVSDIESRGFAYPVIVRETGTHTAVSTALVHSPEDLEAYLRNVEGSSLYVIQFVENASPEGHYSKLRFFAIDGRLYPVVHHIDQVWNVHGSNRKTFMAANPWMLAREHQFLAGPGAFLGTEIYDRLQSLPELIGLEFFGFDFTVLPDGQILIFELNPAMRHSFVHGQNFPYMMPYLQNITDAFGAMVERHLGL